MDPTPHKISLYLLDDHALFREGLLRLLQTDEDFHIFGASGEWRSAVRRIAELAPDILILDFDLGDTTAVEAVAELKQLNFKGHILIVTAGLPDRDALSLIRNGVSGIFHKHQAPEALQNCIKEVARGRTLFEQDYLRDLIASATEQVEDQSAPSLTQRDRQILRFLLEGLANKEIANQLRISESAVKASIQALFAKTGVRTRGQLVRVALERYATELQA